MLRPLWPWRDGLRLKEPTVTEQHALSALEETRAARKAVEGQAEKAERALRRLPPQPAARDDAKQTLQSAAPEGSAALKDYGLTEEQQQRAAANLAAALERKRKREAQAGSSAVASDADGDALDCGSENLDG